MKLAGVALAFSLIAWAQTPEYKNLQLFKNMPPERIPMIMNTFNRVLGVQCTHCHVEGAMEKEDKPQFAMTRKMFAMRNWIASNHKLNVSCWTCHHGNAKPNPQIAQNAMWPKSLDLTPEQEKQPVGSIYKNLKFMTGEAGGLKGGMLFMSNALGVRCEHCHVIGAWDKDDVPAKETARKMLAMVRDMRPEFSIRVGCGTCHRGSVKPELNPPPA